MQDTAGSSVGKNRRNENILDTAVKPLDSSGRSNRRPVYGLPTKLLVITILFVMLAEVLVFVPSIASYRLNWLQTRIDSARLAAMAAEASEGGTVPAMVRRDLLNSAQVRAVALKKSDRRRLVLPADEPLVVDATFDLREMKYDGFWNSFGDRLGLISDALYVFVAPRGRMIAIYGNMQEGTGEPSPTPSTAAADSSPQEYVEVVLPEAPLRAAMVRHGLNILGLSIIISIIAATAVYFTLIHVLVRPMMRITQSMLHFAENPEDPTRVIEPGGRRDEIGVAETQLASMQTQLNQLLQQRRRLAELGLAVSKINHDLRNMLSSAQLISDRLGELPDPTVQRFAPKLIASLDRAIKFCNDTLRFGRAEEAAPRRDLFSLAALVEEVGDGLGLPRENLEWQILMSPTLQVDADRDHLYRVLNNLARNAVQALEAHGQSAMEQRKAPPAGWITVSAERRGRDTIIEVSDNGPGVPAKAREHLFKAFKGGARKGGSGLGLAIAAELINAHGGEISLVTKYDIGREDRKHPENDRMQNDLVGESVDGAGARFRLRIPDRQSRAAS